jgi:hypothetical protein
MLQELAGQTGASGWAIASMLFFLAVWLVMAVRVLRARPEAMSERARMPFDEGEAPEAASPRD